MGILRRQKEKSEKKENDFSYSQSFGEIAERHLGQGLSVSTLPSALRVPMKTIEEWIETEEHFKLSVEFGLAKQEENLTKMGLNLAISNKGNYKAWSALCRVKLGWRMETDPDGEKRGEIQAPVINIFGPGEDHKDE